MMPRLMKSKVKSSRWNLPAGFTVVVLALMLLIGPVGVAEASTVPINLDGMFDGSDSYDNSATVKWYNGHQQKSIYGDFDDQRGTTTIHYGINTLAGTNDEYFFLYADVPLYAKNMIWQANPWSNPLANNNSAIGLTEADVEPYRAQYSHHGDKVLILDFGRATGSEKLVLNNSDGDKQFKAHLAGDVSTHHDLDPVGDFGFVAFMDSVDYLFDNNLADEYLSLARYTKMSFEFQFEKDSTKNAAFVALFDNGIEFHLSPERGNPVPVPGAVYLLGSGLIGMAGIRRKFRK